VSCLLFSSDSDHPTPVCKIPKTAILSVRTSSLPPLGEIKREGGEVPTNLTILHLALALLHELRLAETSPFWGYLQSLPRETVLIPLVWEVEEIGGEDGKFGLGWLKGTEAESDMKKRAGDGPSLVCTLPKSGIVSS
jgi:hypothetical protein